MRRPRTGPLRQLRPNGDGPQESRHDSSGGLGILLHYFIAFLIVSIFYAVSRGVPALRRHTLTVGILYGVVAYFVMNYAVIPLSATTRGPFVLPVFINGILIHAFGVGLPSAWFARD